MRRALVLVMWVLAARPAHGERRPMITGQVDLGSGAADQLVDVPDDVRAAKLVFTLEDRPGPYPPSRGYVVNATLVPELALRGVSVDREADVDRFWAASLGLRTELNGVVRQPFGLGLSARGGAYIAIRLGFFANGPRSRLHSLAFGSYLWLGARLRVGLELDASRYGRREEPGDPVFEVQRADSGRPVGPATLARPFVIGDGQSAYTAITGGLSFGVSL